MGPTGSDVITTISSRKILTPCIPKSTYVSPILNCLRCQESYGIRIPAAISCGPAGCHGRHHSVHFNGIPLQNFPVDHECAHNNVTNDTFIKVLPMKHFLALLWYPRSSVVSASPCLLMEVLGSNRFKLQGFPKTKGNGLERFLDTAM